MSLAPDEKYCGSCGETVKEAAAMCPNCGTSNDGSGPSASATTVYCESCGEQISPEAELCPGCGVRQHSSSSDSDDILYYGQIVLGAILVLSGIGQLTDTGNGVVTSLAGGIALIAVGLVLIPQIRERADKRHPVTTFGWTPVVRTTPVSTPGVACSNCFGDIESGSRRVFGKEFVVAGVVLRERQEGENYYCETCAQTEQKVAELDV